MLFCTLLAQRSQRASAACSMRLQPRNVRALRFLPPFSFLGLFKETTLHTQNERGRRRPCPDSLAGDDERSRDIVEMSASGVQSSAALAVSANCSESELCELIGRVYSVLWRYECTIPRRPRRDAELCYDCTVLSTLLQSSLASASGITESWSSSSHALSPRA